MAKKPPLIVRLLARLFHDDPDGEFDAFLVEQKQAAIDATTQLRQQPQGGFLEPAAFPRRTKGGDAK